jgi:hypothetical protein
MTNTLHINQRVSKISEESHNYLMASEMFGRITANDISRVTLKTFPTEYRIQARGRK